MEYKYNCENCGKSETLDIEWMIEEKKKGAKICLRCENNMMNEAVYGSDKSGCLNCGKQQTNVRF